MKLNKYILYGLSLAALLSVACTKVENIEIEHIGGYNTMNNEKSEEYYANLRAYKASAKNHARPVAFGWYGNWAPSGVMRGGYLSSMPDSMDFVSMWSGTPGRYEITPDQKKDKEFVQKVKGTKLLEVSLLCYLGQGRTPEHAYAKIREQANKEGWDKSKLEAAEKKARWEFWGFDGNFESESHYKALSKFAKAICDTLVVSEWDGYDIDWEIGTGAFGMDGTLETTKHLTYFIKELGKYIGPKSDPEGKGHKMICVDGHFSYLPAELEEYVDYWIAQTYYSGRIATTSPGGHPEKVISTSDFEADAKNGDHIMEKAVAMPETGYKGGIGAYHFEYDYDNSPDYKWMRKAIQINQKVFNEWEAKQGK